MPDSNMYGGGRSYVIAVFGFLCFPSVFGQLDQDGELRNCSILEFYCPKTNSCDIYSETACNTSFCGNDGSITYPCEDGENCYQLIDRCDTVKDCLNGADEMFCSSYWKAAPGFLKCTSSKDGLACKQATTTTPAAAARSSNCHELQFECNEGFGRCYWGFEQCDGRKDCLLGSDEKGCPGTCRYDNERPCNDGNGCYYSGRRCDGFNDCSDNSDEQGCSNFTERSSRSWTISIIGTLVAAVLVVLMTICIICKKARKPTGTQSSAQGRTFSRSAANFQAVNNNNNNSTSPHSPQVTVVIPPVPSETAQTPDPHAVPPYPATTYPPGTQYADSGDVNPGNAFSTTPPPSYDSLFPSK